MSSDDNNHGLGKSLSKVFARTRRKDSANTKGHLEVDITRVLPPRENPRQHFDESALRDLAETIRIHGILQPLTVCRREDGRFEIIAGERRLRAAKLAGATTIPVVVRDDVDPQELAELQLIENLQREDLNPIELAQAYTHHQETFGLSQEELAHKMGKDRSSIANTLRLLTLPEELRAAVATGRLTRGHAKAILGLPDEQARLSLGRKVMAEDLSVRECEERARKHGRRTRGRAKPVPANIKELEENLYKLFGAPVKVRERSGRGTITVNFTSKAGFQRIIEVLGKTIKQADRPPEGG